MGEWVLEIRYGVGEEMRLERGKEMEVIWGRQVNQLKITNKTSCLPAGLCGGEMDLAK